MGQDDIGIAICRSVKLVEQAGREIHSMTELIKREFLSALETDKGLNELIKITEEWSETSRDDDYGWVCTDYAISLGLGHKKGKPKTQRWISIQISLAGDGISSVEFDNEEPLVHINFWSDKVDLEDSYMSIDLDNDVVLKDKVLFSWNASPESWFEQEWTFSLKLASINTLSDIRKMIIEPFSKLIQSRTPESAVLASLDFIVHYEETENGNYRVLSC